MTRQQKRTLLILTAIGVVYFLAFIPASFAGARDPAMLSIFEIDEYAQYPHVLRMLTPGDTFYQSIRNFLIYLHYFYGYPFYFFSALALLPFKGLAGSGWENRTPQIVAILRQMVSVLPMLLGCGLAVFLQTRFRSTWRSIILFLFLLLVPGVVVNNFWWHPDSLAVLFVVLVLFFLDRDDWRFGRYFYLAAVSCGVAVGIKYMGVFYVLAIPVYIGWAAISKRISLPKMVGVAGLFVLVMGLAVVISNPLLLLPIERGELIRYQRIQFEQTMVGVNYANSEPFFKLGQYSEDFRVHYGEVIFIVLTLAALGIGIARKETRRLCVLILAWLLPIMVVINASATRRTHYFLPVVIPLFSCLIWLFPGWEWCKNKLNQNGWRRWLGLWPWAAGVVLVFQAGLFVTADFQKYQTQIRRETDSASVAFYTQLEKVYFSKLPQDQKLVIYRDWHMYYPDKPGRQVELNWDLATPAYIKELHPDVILLDKENVFSFSQAASVEKAVNKEQMAERQVFYGQAGRNELPGYHLLLQGDAGMALVSDDLFLQLK
jgi:hypothetical protein